MSAMRTVICPHCGGLKCTRCDGTGKRLGRATLAVAQRWNVCFACKGTGKRTSCGRCGSTGRIMVPADVSPFS